MKINVKNTDKLRAAIEKVEGRATVRCVTIEDIQLSIETIEKRLSEGFNVYKKNWVGMSFALDPHSQRFANAYKYTPESTQVTIARCASGWFVTSVRRCACWENREIVPLSNTENLIREHARW